MAAPIEIAAKLTLTSQALGCGSHKELCGRFRAVNPTTYFDLQRSRKWMQGKAEPRFAEVYQDWAKVLGLDRDGAWIAGSSVDEFVDELQARFGVKPIARADARSAGTLESEITGLYAAYSMAWSPHFRGRVLRGSMKLGRLRSASLLAEYHEDLPIGASLYRGDATIAGRTLSVPLHEAATGLPLFMSFALPGLPAAVLGGVQCGVALLSHGTEPMTGRILLAKLRGAPDPRASNRYMEKGESVAADLARLGLSLPPGSDERLHQALAKPDCLTTAEQTGLSDLFDPAFLAC
ncbi:hypothetical protein EJV46_20540 [Roseococcus sp. SYP-B2431]|uniref:hypothetical protein n=1 Tax=Roseococcus sp. SYP-B2431 TaxID=2496640 RepID=UPI00103D97EA|nr:hypothetical protein [Roseococcus sp. SYP-B2431]TCH96371.1 hypothetical protein EJV46_20540 [Roseococcus sp. SYP-B2431]